MAAIGRAQRERQLNALFVARAAAGSQQNFDKAWKGLSAEAKA